MEKLKFIVYNIKVTAKQVSFVAIRYIRKCLFLEIKDSRLAK